MWKNQLNEGIMTKNKQKDYKIDTKEKICNTVRR